MKVLMELKYNKFIVLIGPDGTGGNLRTIHFLGPLLRPGSLNLMSFLQDFLVNTGTRLSLSLSCWTKITL